MKGLATVAMVGLWFGILVVTALLMIEAAEIWGRSWASVWIFFVAAETYRRTVNPFVVGFRRRWKGRGDDENTSDE